MSMSTENFQGAQPVGSTSRTVPVSRTSFALTDRNAFDATVQLAVSWMARTSATSLPDLAYKGEGFDWGLEGVKAYGSALRLDDELGRIWAAKITYCGDVTAGRDWITDLFVEQRKGAFVRFGAQLACRCSRTDPGFEHSRPRIIRDVLSALAAEADREVLSNVVEDVELTAVGRLTELLYNPERRLPVVLISIDDDGRAQIDLERLANRLSGTAHLRCISIEPSFELSRYVGKRMSTFNGAVRVYMPGLDQETEDPFEHPLWLSPPSGRSPWLLNTLASRVLPLGFRDPDGEARFWRVGLLRQATSRAVANSSIGTQEEQLQAEVNALRAEIAVVREAAQSAEALMYEEASKLKDVRAEVSRWEDENAILRARIRAVGTHTKSSEFSLTPDDVHALFDQSPSLETSLRIAASVFPDRVIILDTAFESARDSFAFKYRKKAFDLIWTLCTTYWSALSNGESDATARRCFGAGFAAKESEKLSKSGRKRRTFEFAGSEVEMEKHLKIGVADNKADTLRIHFEWLGKERRIVVGHCGEHLDF